MGRWADLDKPVAPAKGAGTSGSGVGDWLKNLRRNAVQDVKDIGKAIPAIPRILEEESANFWASHPALGGSTEGKKADARRRAAVKEARLAAGATPGKGDVGQRILNASTMPGVRLLPVVGTVAGGWKGVYEHPVSALLDVLPFATKAAGLATKGGSLASVAEDAARASGKVAKAERIAEKGLNLKQVIGAGEKALEANIAKRAPMANRALPRTLTRTVFGGGEQARDVARIASDVGASHADDVAKIVDEAAQTKKVLDTEKLARDFKVKTPEVEASWTPEEAAYAQAYRAESEANLAELAKQRGAFWKGEYFEEPRMRSAVRRVEQAEKQLAALEAKGVKGRQLGFAKQQVKEARYTVNNLASTNAPVRFKQLIVDLARDELISRLPENLSPERRADLTNRIMAGRYADAGFTKRQYLEAVSRYKNDWSKLRNRGYDPIWMHHVPTEKVRELARPSIKAGKITTESVTKRRSWHPEPYVEDTELARAHLKAETSRVAREAEVVQRIYELGWMKKADEIEPFFASYAGEKAAGKPYAAQEALRRRLVKASYDTYSPREAFGAGYRGTIPEGTYYVPKGMGKVLKQLSKPILAESDIARWAGKTNKALSMQVLYANPMYYLGNMVTNSYLVTEVAGIQSLAQIRKAFRAWREGSLPPAIRGGASLSGDAEQALAASRNAIGTTMREILGEELGPVRKTASAINRKVQRMAGFMDDMARAMAYFEGIDDAVKRGLSQQDAVLYGLDLARQAQGVFESLTPAERAITKVVAPYYPWSRFILQHAWNLPFEHPMRIAILNSFTRAEVADWDSDLPLKLRSLYLFGDGDIRKGFNTNNFNPYAQIGDMLTIDGLLGRVSPLIQTGLSQIGHGVSGQGPDLFPNLRFNPETGREQYDPPALHRELLKNQFPTLAGVIDRVFADPELAEMAVSNPKAYQRRIRSELGPVLSAIIPVAGSRDPSLGTVREVDLAEERSKLGKAEGRVERNRKMRERSRPAPAVSTGGGSGSGGRWADM